MPDNPSPPHLEVSISERESLLLVAERVAHVGSWVWDVETHEVQWSDELYRIFGYDPATESPTIERFFAALHPDDRASVEASSVALVTTGVTRSAHFRFLRRDGSIRHTHANSAVVQWTADHKPKRIVGTIHDITEMHQATLELRHAHHLLEEAQELARLGTWFFDFTTRRRTWSTELYHLLGVPLDAEPSRERFLQHVHPDDFALMDALFRTIDDVGSGRIPPRDTIDDIEVRVVRPDGDVRYLRIRAAFERDEAGRICGVRGVSQDMTDLTLLQKRLARAERMELIGRLAGGIAHDFNNIMTVINAGAELLAAGEPADREILAQMKAAVASARELTSRLLAFGRQSTLRLQRVDPNQVVRDTVRLVTRILGEHIALELDLDGGVPAATLDPHLTGQALINLLINARDAMPGGGRIVMSTRAVDGADGPMVELGVRDSGPGIAASLRERVFEPFFTTKHESHGTGLGLAMVQGAVEQQGGTITLETGAHGTLFLLRFPAVRAEPSTVSAGAAARGGGGRSLRILLVEDQESLAAMVQRLLRRAGHHVWTCLLPSQAIACYREHAHEIDLVLSDVLMPEMSGMEMMARLAEIAPLPRVLYMSGYGAEVAKELGPDRPLLPKPFTHVELVAAIERALA